MVDGSATVAGIVMVSESVTATGIAMMDGSVTMIGGAMAPMNGSHHDRMVMSSGRVSTISGRSGIVRMSLRTQVGGAIPKMGGNGPGPMNVDRQ